MAEYYDDILRLCGFGDEEINRERLRMQTVFQKLELGPADMKKAESWVGKNHDVALAGVRKLLGVWLRELFDLVLAKEEGKRVVYYGFPGMVGLGMLIATASEKVFCGCPDVILCHTLGQIFNKLAPILEAGEKNGLPPGHGLCTLQTIRVGALAKGIIPVPDLAMMSSFYCDMGSKTDDLLREIYGHQTAVIDGSMDSEWGEYPGFLPERVKFLGAQLNGFIAKVREVLGVRITPDIWARADAISGQLVTRIDELSQLMRADPPPVSVVELELAGYLLTGATGKAMVYGPEAVATLIQEVKDRINAGIGVVEKGAPRVMLFVPSFADPSVGRMIEETGLAVPLMQITSPFRTKRWGTTYIDKGEAKADKELKGGVFHSTYAVARRWAEIAQEFNLDGSIFGYQFNCRPLALPSHILPKYVEETTGLPTLSLEMDYYDPRNYSAAALRTRVETFAEMLRARKATAKA